MSLISKSSRVLVVAERMNIGKRWPHSERLVEQRCYENWLRTSVTMGAFGAGWTSGSQLKSTGRRKLLSIGLPEDFDALNLLPPGECGEWDRDQARAVADELRTLIVTAYDEREHLDVDPLYDSWLYDRVVILGKRAAEAMDHRAEFFVPVGGAICVPHPSGRCRWWNDPHAMGLGGIVLREFLTC